MFSSDCWSAYYVPQLPDAFRDVLGLNDANNAEGSEMTDWIHCHPDLCWVPHKCDGAMSKRLWEYQLRSQGLEIWADRVKSRHGALAYLSRGGSHGDDPTLPDPTVAKHVHFKGMESKAVHIQVVAVTTDAGPDQVAARNLVQAELAEDIYSWVFWGCCFLHQVHLMVKRQLTRCPSFFSDMAKMSNVWRSAGTAVQIFNAWKHLFGKARADRVASSLPPRVLTGRFGALERVSQFFSRATQRETAAVFEDVFLHALVTPARKRSVLVHDLDEEDYSVKLGRWKRGALEAARDLAHWRLMYILTAARGPAMHLMNFLQKEASSAKVFRANVTYPHDTDLLSTLQKLVYTEAARFRREFDALFSDEAYEDPNLWGLVWQHNADDNDIPQIRGLCTLFALEMAADYIMRICDLLQKLEYQILWFAYHGPLVHCGRRKDVAQKLLDTLKPDYDKSSGDSPWKIATVFRDELEQCVRSEGQIHPEVHRIFVLLARMWACDTQEIEGINGIIKRMLKQYPAMGLFLLNTRVLSRKTLAEASSRSLPFPIEDKISECIVFHEQAKSCIADRERHFAPDLDEDHAPSAPLADGSTLDLPPDLPPLIHDEDAGEVDGDVENELEEARVAQPMADDSVCFLITIFKSSTKLLDKRKKTKSSPLSKGPDQPASPQVRHQAAGCM